MYWNYNFSSIKKQGERLEVDTQNCVVTFHSVISGKDELKMSGRYLWMVNLTTKCLKLKWHNQLCKLTKLSPKCTKNRSCGKDTPTSQLHKHLKMKKKIPVLQYFSSRICIHNLEATRHQTMKMIKVLAILT